MTEPNAEHGAIDYAAVLAIIVANDAPAEALRSFVEQEREHAAHKARPSGLDLDMLARTNAERCVRWHPPESEPWSLADWSNAMCGEAGEAANMVKKLRRIETRTDTGPWAIPHSTVPGETVILDRGQQSRIYAKGIGLELADVVIYADLLAQQLAAKYGGYPLSELIETKFNAVSHREGFPEQIRLPRGPVTRTRDSDGRVLLPDGEQA